MPRHAQPRRGLRTSVGNVGDVRDVRDVRGHTSAEPRPSRSASPSSRRPVLLLGAVVAGALVAALPIGAGAAGPDAQPLTVSTLATGTLTTGTRPDATESPVAGVEPTADGNGEVAARPELSAAEAEVRLEVLRADRASRAAARSEAAAQEAQAAAEALRPKFVLPTKGRLSSCFCQRWGTMHWGIDIAAPMYTPILAVADAVVVKAGAASGYGNVVELQHEDGTVSLYGHMETIEVSVGDLVSAGQLVAKVGSRGFSTGPHLHLEIYPDGLTGARVDPQRWLADRGIAV